MPSGWQRACGEGAEQLEQGSPRSFGFSSSYVVLQRDPLRQCERVSEHPGGVLTCRAGLHGRRVSWPSFSAERLHVHILKRLTRGSQILSRETAAAGLKGEFAVETSARKCDSGANSQNG